MVFYIYTYVHIVVCYLCLNVVNIFLVYVCRPCLKINSRFVRLLSPPKLKIHINRLYSKVLAYFHHPSIQLNLPV